MCQVKYPRVFSIQAMDPVINSTRDAQVLTGKEDQREISTIGLKTVVLEMPCASASQSNF